MVSGFELVVALVVVTLPAVAGIVVVGGLLRAAGLAVVKEVALTLLLLLREWPSWEFCDVWLLGRVVGCRRRM